MMTQAEKQARVAELRTAADDSRYIALTYRLSGRGSWAEERAATVQDSCAGDYDQQADLLEGTSTE